MDQEEWRDNKKLPPTKIDFLFQSKQLLLRGGLYVLICIGLLASQTFLTALAVTLAVMVVVEATMLLRHRRDFASA